MSLDALNILLSTFAALLVSLNTLIVGVACLIECVIHNAPVGVGEPVFNKLDALLAKAMLSIGAVKGFEMGDGFSVARANGSDNNDEMSYSKDVM